MAKNTEFNKNYFFIYQTFVFLSLLMLRAEAKSKTEYKGYFKNSSDKDYLLTSDSRCTRNDFMDEVVKSTESGGCGASERNMDLSNIFGDTSCSTDLRSTTITRYGSANDIFDDCICDLLKRVDENCDDQYWETVGYIIAGLVALGILACVGIACYKGDVVGKTVHCFGSLKNSALSLTDRCKRIGATDNSNLESGEPHAEPKSSYNISAFFNKFLKTGKPVITNETELQETPAPQ